MFTKQKKALETALTVLQRDGVAIFFKRLKKYCFEKLKNCNLVNFFIINIKGDKIVNQEDLISVVIPVYDRVNKLEESICSILQQSYKNFEIIIVTDGSPEKTLDLLKKYKKNSKIKIFYYLNNTGNAVRGRNKGIKEAKGKYIAFQDSDDIADKDRLKKSLIYINKFKADVVYGGWRAMIDETRSINGINNGQEIISPNCDLEDLKNSCVLCQSTVMVRKEVLTFVGGLKNTMEYCEDYELWLRLAYFGYKFKAIPSILTNLRLHKGNNELNFIADNSNWRSMALEEYKKKARLSQKIAYIIPGVQISGGIAVVLQHANRLLKKGYDVFIISQDFRTEINWFPDNKVMILSEDEERYLFDGIDILIGTSSDTVELMKKIDSKRKIYFVQSDERRFVDDEKIKKEIEKTYQTNCEYMTEAKWIQDWLKREFNHNSFYVPNGLDKKIFYKSKPIERKTDKKRVLLEGAINVPYKGVGDAYLAVKDIDCELWIVSNKGRPPKGWIFDRFFEDVDMNNMKAIYSSCDILLKMSKVEGFFGPPMEAMACGCAVVTGKCTGYDEYINDEKNALVVEQGDISGAEKAVRRLIKDNNLYQKLVYNGYKTVEKWNWEISIDLLEKVILNKE